MNRKQIMTKEKNSKVTKIIQEQNDFLTTKRKECWSIDLIDAEFLANYIRGSKLTFTRIEEDKK